MIFFSHRSRAHLIVWLVSEKNKKRRRNDFKKTKRKMPWRHGVGNVVHCIWTDHYCPPSRRLAFIRRRHNRGATGEKEGRHDTPRLLSLVFLFFFKVYAVRYKYKQAEFSNRIIFKLLFGKRSAFEARLWSNIKTLFDWSTR